MKDYVVRILRNKVTEGGEPIGGEGKLEEKIEGDPAPDDKSKDKPDDKKGDPPPKGEGDKEYDELGYEKAPKKSGEKKPDEKKDPAPDAKKVENSTGYGDEEPKVEEVDPKDKPPEKKEDPPPEPKDIDKKLEALTKVNAVMAEKTKQQATDLGLEGEKLDKFIAHRMAEQQAAGEWAAAQERAAKRAAQERHAGWHKELKADPDFGGDKFATNITRANKVLEEFGPEFKKELTDNGVMLRPSVMRMLARIADHSYPDRDFTQGDPPSGKDEDKDTKDKPNDPLAFYNEPQ